MTTIRPAADAHDDPIAVVGIGCRFPGSATDLRSFGTVVSRGSDVFVEVPADRWGRSEQQQPGGRGSIANHVGAFLSDIDRFDTAYFGISPREASFIDPQQRVLLEVAWEAMADSGRPRSAWHGSSTAVFVGMLANDYQLLHARALGEAGIGPHYVTGIEPSFAAGRLAYTFDLHGPVATVSSACSSSLLAVHEACQSLRTGECDTALAAGVSLLVGPELSIFLSTVGAVSPTGRCRPFDAAADGLVRGEGCGVIVLKRLAAAIDDGDHIYAVIRGSAVTHDGASMGLTAPNGAAQALMLQTALAHAGVRASEVDYVEAHGTGTQLGDQIELGALDDVYGSERESPLLVGSVKAVFGHTDAAAGVAGLLKAIWVTRSGQVPQQPNFDVPNPALNWSKLRLAVPTRNATLSPTGRPVRAGVSAFGLSGTNVHVVLESAPQPATCPAADGPYIVLVSASREDCLAEQVDRMRSLVGESENLSQLAASAATRSTFETHRYAAVGDDRRDITSALGDPSDPPDGGFAGVVPDPDNPPSPVFVYSGQGGQWPGMAFDLYQGDPGIRASLDECDALIQNEASWSLIDELRQARDEGMGRTDRAQPAIFAVQVALTRWLTARGVTPHALVGHSLGEVAAAHAARSLSLPDAVRLIVRRAELLQQTAGTGVMFAVRCSPGSTQQVLQDHAPSVMIAAINGPSSVVIAGAPEDTKAAVAALTARGVHCRQLRVDAASHSPIVSHCGPLLADAMTGLRLHTPTIRLLSTVDPEHDDVRQDAAYWGRNLTQPVHLWQAVDRLLREAEHTLIEVGPHPVLISALADAIAHRGARSAVLSTLTRRQPGLLALHRTLAQLHVVGVPIAWEATTGWPRSYHPLPVPAWGGDRYWLPGVSRGTPSTSPVPHLDTALTRISADTERHSGNAANPVATRPSANHRNVRAAGGAAAGHAPVSAVADRVENAVRAVLGLDDGRRLLRRRGLFEQGLDSLTATQLRVRLEADFGQSLPASVVFDHPTINALAAYLTQTAGRPLASNQADVPQQLTADTAVAVVGVSCRLPGAGSPAEFWTLLMQGRVSVGEPPPGRRDDPIWSESDVKIPTRSCYLDDVGAFDAAFFRISPREARSIDPQQRLMLEVAWEALEDAGCPASSLEGRPVGVYVGLEAADYQQLLTRDMKNVDLYYGTGTSFAAVAGRLSYFLGLTGPSLVVDTACSASLTAVHLACQGLRNGDCEVAVVGGVHVMAAPTLMVAMTESGALAPDGQCKTFDDAADGYGCGEGAAVLVLKPLRAAQHDGDRIYAVIRGSAVNQDGASGGFTVPNAGAQTALIRQALSRTGWVPDDVDYLEAHGTGTPLGDPIEVNALAEAYGTGRGEDHPLLIGAVKPNVGHLAAAAGVTGLLKVALALRHRRIPAHLISRPSSRIDWERLPVALPTQDQPWPDRGRPSRAGISSFGLTGTNVHVLVEQAPHSAAYQPPATWPLLVLPLSASHPSALREVASRIAERLRETPDGVTDIVYTTTYRRSWLSHRLAAVGRNAAELAEALERFANTEAGTRLRRGHVEEETAYDVDFRYGSRMPSEPVWRRLAEAPAYQQALSECAEHLSAITGTSQDLHGDPVDADASAYLLCHQIAATRLWQAYGVRPTRCIGSAIMHAWTDGGLTLTEAIATAVGADVEVESHKAAAGLAVEVIPEVTSGADPLEWLALRVAELYVAGFRPVSPSRPYPPVSLPGYPWQHRSYWYRDKPAPARAATSSHDATTFPPCELQLQIERLGRFVEQHWAVPTEMS